MASIDYYGRLFDEPLDISPAVARAANIAATFGKAIITAKTPVDTGKLKSNWNVKLEGNGVRITNSTNYAGFVEFGTRRMSGRSMMTSSLPEIQDVFISELYSDIGEAIGADLLTDFAKPGYSNAVNAAKPKLFPEVGNNIQSKIGTGLSKRTKNTTKSFLFSNPSKILSGKQEARIAKAKPKYGKSTITQRKAKP